MRLEFIDRIKENDILGKSILTSDGKILLKNGIVLTNTYIRKLKEIGVFYIYIEDERLDDIEIEDEKLAELKQLTMKSISSIIRNVNCRNGKGFTKSLGYMEKLIDYIVEIKDVNKSLLDIKTYDNYTYLHCLHTCVMACLLGIANGIKRTDLRELGIGAALHDIGKIKVPIKILNKNGRLTQSEFEEMKKHPIYGVDIMRRNRIASQIIVNIIKQHHEKINGMGYPDGLQGNQISKYAKIVSICDVYDAVSNDRCYRRKFTPNDAYELILAGSGSSFDEELVIKFKDTFSIYPLGCCVKLSSGEEGYVINQNKGFPDRPIVRILYDSTTKKPISFYEINLVKSPNITIESIV